MCFFALLSALPRRDTDLFPHEGYTFTLTINDIPDWGPGAYTLKFDMVFSSTWGTSFWFSSSGQPDWPTYDVGICVDGLCKVFLPVVLKNY